MIFSFIFLWILSFIFATIYQYVGCTLLTDVWGWSEIGDKRAHQPIVWWGQITSNWMPSNVRKVVLLILLILQSKLICWTSNCGFTEWAFIQQLAYTHRDAAVIHFVNKAPGIGLPQTPPAVSSFWTRATDVKSCLEWNLVRTITDSLWELLWFYDALDNQLPLKKYKEILVLTRKNRATIIA